MDKSRIMYVELKSGHGDRGPAWIGRVHFNRTGRTLLYRKISLEVFAVPDVPEIITMLRREMRNLLNGQEASI